MEGKCREKQHFWSKNVFFGLYISLIYTRTENRWLGTILGSGINTYLCWKIFHDCISACRDLEKIIFKIKKEKFVNINYNTMICYLGHHWSHHMNFKIKQEFFILFSFSVIDNKLHKLKLNASQNARTIWDKSWEPSHQWWSQNLFHTAAEITNLVLQKRRLSIYDNQYRCISKIIVHKKAVC